jgi:hypothetical protein
MKTDGCYTKKSLRTEGMVSDTPVPRIGRKSRVGLTMNERYAIIRELAPWSRQARKHETSDVQNASELGRTHLLFNCWFDIF